MGNNFNAGFVSVLLVAFSYSVKAARNKTRKYSKIAIKSEDGSYLQFGQMQGRLFSKTCASSLFDEPAEHEMRFFGQLENWPSEDEIFAMAEVTSQPQSKRAWKRLLVAYRESHHSDVEIPSVWQANQACAAVLEQERTPAVPDHAAQRRERVQEMRQRANDPETLKANARLILELHGSVLSSVSEDTQRAILVGCDWDLGYTALLELAALEIEKPKKKKKGKKKGKKKVKASTDTTQA